MNPRYLHHHVQDLFSRKQELSFQVHFIVFPSTNPAVKFNSVIDFSLKMICIFSLPRLFSHCSFCLMMLLPDETHTVFFEVLFYHCVLIHFLNPSRKCHLYIFPFYIVLLLLVNHFYSFARLKVPLGNSKYFISLNLFYST